MARGKDRGLGSTFLRHESGISQWARCPIGPSLARIRRPRPVRGTTAGNATFPRAPILPSLTGDQYDRFISRRKHQARRPQIQRLVLSCRQRGRRSGQGIEQAGAVSPNAGDSGQRVRRMPSPLPKASRRSFGCFLAGSVFGCASKIRRAAPCPSPLQGSASPGCVSGTRFEDRSFSGS